MLIQVFLGKPEIHKSMINLYLLCPRRFYYEYVLNLPKISSYPALVGTAFHNFAKYFFETTEEPESLVELLEKKPEIEDRELSSMITWWIEYEYKRYRENPFAWKPVAMEAYVEREFPEYIMAGTVDRIDRIGPDEYIIIEYKTSRRNYINDWRRELVFYNMILDGIYNIIYYRVINPRTRSILDLKPSKNIEREIKKIIKRMIADREYRANPSDLCFYCPYKSKCKYYRDNGIWDKELFDEIKNSEKQDLLTDFLGR